MFILINTITIELPFLQACVDFADSVTPKSDTVTDAATHKHNPFLSRSPHRAKHNNTHSEYVILPDLDGLLHGLGHLEEHVVVVVEVAVAVIAVAVATAVFVVAVAAVAVTAAVTAAVVAAAIAAASQAQSHAE